MNPENERFNFNDSTWQIVRREFIYRKDSISITFLPEKGGLLQISKAAMKALGNPTFGQILINPKTRKLVLMGADIKMANSILLRPLNSQGTDGSIPCEALITRAYDLMEWESGNKYVVRGRLTKANQLNKGRVLVFDLNHSCMYKKKEAKQRERGHTLAKDYTKRFGLGIRPAELLQGEGNPVL
ncbi:MAG: hypothetical protein IKG87_14610 [Clostridia bacterium]|nr:hypothetical protein [Clostridia bacterium]